MLRKYGSDVVNDLQAREKLTKKWTDDELKDIRDYYKQRLSDLKAGIVHDTRRNDPISVSSLWGDTPLTGDVSLMSVFNPTVQTNDNT